LGFSLELLPRDLGREFGLEHAEKLAEDFFVFRKGDDLEMLESPTAWSPFVESASDESDEHLGSRDELPIAPAESGGGRGTFIGMARGEWEPNEAVSVSSSEGKSLFSVTDSHKVSKSSLLDK